MNICGRCTQYIPAKDLSEPVSTIAPMLSSESACCIAVASSTNNDRLSALRALGLFRVMRKTPSAGVDVKMFSYVFDMTGIVEP